MYKSIKTIIFFSIFVGIYACSPKLEQEIESKKIELPPVVEEQKEINPNCLTFSDLNYTDRENAETAYVLYKDQLKTKHYQEAKKLWKMAFYTAPAANGRIKYQYDDGIKIYQALYKETKDTILRKLYIDTIMSIYDRRMECRGDTSYVLGRKAYDYYYVYPGIKTNDEIFDIMKKAIDLTGDKTDYFIINPFTQLLIEQYTEKKIDKSTAKKYTYQILNTVNYGLAHCKRDCESWKIVNEYAPARLEAFEALSDFYECDYYVNKYYHEYEEDSTNCEIINRTYSRLNRGKCDEQSKIFITVANAKAELCKPIVTTPGPCRLGYTAYTNGEYKNAIESFKECIESLTVNEKKAKYNMLIAKIYYRDLKNFPQARKFALKAAKLKSNWGEPFMLIGRLYASSGPLCGTGRGFESQKVVWPAIDKWKYAKKIDPSVVGDANKLINTYSQYMPSKGDLFQRTIEIGSKFKVGCWINEMTIVRSAD